MFFRPKRIALSSAELWNPETQAWMALPPMARERSAPTAYVLPSGRVAVLDALLDGGPDNGEMFDLATQTWEPLPAQIQMACRLKPASVVPVSGGLIAVGHHPERGTELRLGACPTQLYDDASGRWLKLPCSMENELRGVGFVHVPVEALLAATAASEDQQ